MSDLLFSPVLSRPVAGRQQELAVGRANNSLGTLDTESNCSVFALIVQVTFLSEFFANNDVAFSL